MRARRIVIVLGVALLAAPAMAGGPSPGGGPGAAPLPPEIPIWEAWAKGYATIASRYGGFWADAFGVNNSGPVTIVIDEHVMLFSPSPANPSEDQPGIDDETQDGILTPTQTIASRDTLTFHYGDQVAGGLLPPPPWWCAEETEYTRRDIEITLGGEILPYELAAIVDNYDQYTQWEVWAHFRNYPTLVIGKRPLWTEIQNIGDEVDVTLEVTNIGFWAATGVTVTDTIPPGYSYDPSSFSNAPVSIVDNPDGSITLTWVIGRIDGAVETSRDEPTRYSTIYIGYKLLTPAIAPDLRVQIPRAYVDRQGDGVDDAESAEVLLESFLVNQPPVALPGGPYTVFLHQGVTLDGSQSYDPDETWGDAIVSYEWDIDGDGVSDKSGPIVDLLPAEVDALGLGIHVVTLAVSDGYGARTTASTTLEVLLPISSLCDIKPGSDTNPINLKSNGVIPVAILGAASHDVYDIDPTTVTFGPDAAPEAHKVMIHYGDVDGDGFIDAMFHFRTQMTGIGPDDEEACISWTTYSGESYTCCDGIGMVPSRLSPSRKGMAACGGMIGAPRPPLEIFGALLPWLFLVLVLAGRKWIGRYRRVAPV